MGQGRARRVSRPLVEVEAEPSARRDRHRAAGEGAEAQLRSLQIGHDADRPSYRALDRANGGDALAVILLAPVAEIEPENVDAGMIERADHILARTRRP